MDATAVHAMEMRAGRREWTGLAVLSLPTLLLALDFSVLFLALPHLGADLGASSTQLLWIQDVYGFLIAGFLVTMGTLGDRIGRRRLLLIGATAFGVISVLAAYAPSAEALIILRALLGIAGATVMPSTLALISNMFVDARQRTTAISLWATCLLVGVAIGPVIGGLLLERFWWGSVFLMGVPVMVLLVVTAPALLPEYRDPEPGRLDLASVVLSLAAILPVVYALKEFAKDGGLRPLPVFVLLVGLAFAALFVRRQRRLADPLLDLRLFGDRAFSSALGVLLLGTVAIGGIGFLFAQYLQLVHGLSPLQAGLWLVPDALALIAGSLLAPVFTRWVAPAVVVGAGLAVTAAGFVLLSQVGTGTALVVAVAALSLTSLGIAPIWVLGTDLVVGSAPPQKAGSAAAMSETAAELGIASGVALLGSISMAAYRGQVTVPGDLPDGAAETVADSLVGAAAVAGTLPAELAGAVLGPAREAFTSGVNLASALSVPAVLVLAGLSFVLLRRVAADDPVTGDAADQNTEPAAEPAALAGPAGDGLVLPARGVLIRHRDLVLLCEAVPGRGDRIGALVDAVTAGPDPSGEILSRRLAGLLGAAGPGFYPALCAFGPAGDGIAVVVHGPAEVTVTGGDRQVRLDGREAVTLVDRLLAGPFESIRAAIPGSALVIPQGAGWPPSAELNGSPPAAEPTPPDVDPPGPPEGRPPGVPVAGPGGDMEEAVEQVEVERVEVERVEVERVEVEQVETAGPNGIKVYGIYCRQAHFNDPEVTYCTVCGCSMTQAIRMPLLGTRPPLGVLVLDDGTLYPLAREYVIGRVPEDDESVSTGRASPVRLGDPMVSRVHARVVLSGWEVRVVDAGSTNGTYVCPPGEQEWTRVPTGLGMTLRPGSMAALGRRQLRYHSHRNFH
ncbi:MAG TPA: MFS transporter [Pseudonocardiaceae bacterium]|nr:MFS transporter [Pseudonocardiaceae bacterium]